MNTSVTLPALFYLTISLFYFVTTLSALRKLRIYKIADYLLVFYLVVSCFTSLILFAGEMGWLDVFVEGVSQHFPLYGLLLLSGIFHNLTYAVFHEDNPGWAWILLIMILIGAALSLDGNFFSLPEVVWRGIWGSITRFDISSFIITAGWGGFTLFSILYLRQALASTDKTVVRNRSYYWVGGLIFFTGGSILLFTAHPMLGFILLFTAALILDYMVITYRLPDLRNLVYVLASNVLSGTLVLLLFALGFLIFDRIFIEVSWYHPLYNAALMALLLLFIYPGINRNVKGIIQHIIGDDFNRRRALSKYSKRVSSILDLELLSRVTVELICDELDVEEGILFLADKVDPEKDPPDWCLRAVKGVGETIPNLDLLPAMNPITRVFVEEKRVLSQSELEVIPKYQTIPKKLYTWLNAVEAEAYVPIHTQDEWIGLFALSMKKSGGSFTDEDLEFLSAVADQTSVALQNARLVENLTNIDNELRRTKAAHNEALEKIERIKRSASDFISIKAHELRSPLTVMSGYTRLLSNDSALKDHEYHERLINGILVGLERLQEIIDNMLYTAQIQPRSLRIDTEPISLYTVIDKVCQDLQKKVQARKITLSHDGLGDIPKVYGDRKALMKVFGYLITHAMTHTPSGGKISITGRHIPLRSELLKWEGAEIIVRDTGIGVDADLQQKIFQDLAYPETSELSFDGEQISAEKGEPTERLSIVRAIVEAHRGRVWVESPKEGESELPGSEFHVVIPLRQQSHPTQTVA
ncbi:MAG: GAF domain-containing sensor histidine kinase [Anaerolineales bacterium]